MRRSQADKMSLLGVAPFEANELLQGSRADSGVSDVCREVQLSPLLSRGSFDTTFSGHDQTSPMPKLRMRSKIRLQVVHYHLHKSTCTPDTH